ncbi:hypothetical protein ACFQ14_02830 [Pseudahrensia aquimaris]|uniref:Uncharacterized protein n=1 Tax=Pseudahrensia aquimaris TaxID=744461 RepID=A0ABW3FBS1_9HYPH
MRAVYFYFVWAVAIGIWSVALVFTLLGYTNGMPMFGNVALAVSVLALIAAIMLGKREGGAS